MLKSAFSEACFQNVAPVLIFAIASFKLIQQCKYFIKRKRNLIRIISR